VRHVSVSFCSQANCADGYDPVAGLVQATDGNFYGTTYKRWVGRSGTAFSPFVAFVRSSGKVGWRVEILGQGFTGISTVSLNRTAANFLVQFDTYLTATVPQQATTGFVTVTTPGGTTREGAEAFPRFDLARIAGHSSIAMSARYVHPSEDAVLTAMSRLGGHKSGHSENRKGHDGADKSLLSD
jgi:hypothetical protein